MIAEDILVFGQGETEEEALTHHNKNLEQLLQRAEERRIKVNRRKENSNTGCLKSVTYYPIWE